MNTNSELLTKHPNYRLMFLTEPELRQELINWSREDLISWLSWNDSNGIYDDEQSLEELGNIMSYEEGIEIIINQILQEKNGIKKG